MPGASSRRFTLFLVLLAVALVLWVARPFWSAFFLAAVLAAAFDGWTGRLARLLGGRRGPAAALVVLGVVLVIVVPLAGLATVLVRQAIDGVGWVRQALAAGGVWGLVHRLPAPLAHAVERLVAAIPNPEQRLQAAAGAGGGQAAAAVGGLLAATGETAFHLAMTLVALYFLLVDGARLVDWLDENVPLGPGQLRALLQDFRRTSVSVLVATLATAGIQTLTAVAGYVVTRAPNPLFLALVTFVFALVPALGGTAAVLAVAALLAATGHVIQGIVLAAWGIVLVALADNVARPYLLKGGMALHGGIVFFALLGGVAAFGAVGLVAGPLVVTFLVSALRTWRRERAAAAPPAAG